MKNLCITALACATICGNAHGVVSFNCCTLCEGATYHANCTNGWCDSCSGTVSVEIINGVCTPTCNSGSSGGGGGNIKPNPNNPVIPIDPDPGDKTCKVNEYNTTGRPIRIICEPCPQSGLSSGGLSTVRTDCYLAAGTVMTDETGEYVCSASSYWQN